MALDWAANIWGGVTSAVGDVVELREQFFESSGGNSTSASPAVHDQGVPGTQATGEPIMTNGPMAWLMNNWVIVAIIAALLFIAVVAFLWGAS